MKNMTKNFKKLISIVSVVALLAISTTTCFASQVYKSPISLAESEDGEIEFINSSATNYVIEFADQGKVEWNGIESGLKDFTFSLAPIEELSEKYEGVEFISFESTPEFSTEADISLAIVVDNTDPALYILDENDELFRLKDVEIVQDKNSTFFKFKDTKLAKTYMLSPVVIPGVPELTKEPVVEEVVPVPETVEELPTTETTQEATDAPKTGVNDTLPIVALFIGLAGMLSVIFIKGKKEN